MTGLEYPVWQKPYLDALLETDDQRISERIQAAQDAILARMTSMQISAETSREALKLNIALRDLRNLRELRGKPESQHKPSSPAKQSESSAE